jgi:hypothetical protein
MRPVGAIRLSVLSLLLVVDLAVFTTMAREHPADLVVVVLILVVLAVVLR